MLEMVAVLVTCAFVNDYSIDQTCHEKRYVVETDDCHRSLFIIREESPDAVVKEFSCARKVKHEPISDRRSTF